jgi:hypothetical protein
LPVKKFPVKKFDSSRLPQPTGIPFAEILGIKIPSRDTVARVLSEFIKKSKMSKNAIISLIKAEWGEGKTDAYDRYITKELADHFHYSVSTSTVIIRLEMIKKDSTSGNTASNLIAAIFASIGDDIYNKEGKKDKIFYKEKINDPVEYYSKVISKILKGNKKNLYIFIDEFEEILHSAKIKTDIISGMKEIFNKQLGIISQGGEFAGRVHFFIASTPHAWNKIIEDPDLSNIMGGLERRLAPYLVELPALTKEDCYNFLAGLFKYSYGNNFKRLPIASGGVIETIANVSHNNPGNLIQTFSHLMHNVQDIDSSNINCIDFEQVFKDLATQNLAIFGSTIPAIDSSIMSHFQRELDDDKARILQLLLGEQKPFMLDEIANRIGIGNITNHINEINQKLELSVNLSSAIQHYFPAKDGVNFDTILSLFTTSPGKESIIIDRYNVDTEIFKTALLHHEIDPESCHIEEKILLPKDEKEFAKLLDLDSTISKKLHNIVRRKFDEAVEKRHYLPSIDIKENIFPSPSLIKFNFVKERTKRLEIRRSIQKLINMPQQRQAVNKKLTDAIIEAVQYQTRQGISNAGISFERNGIYWNLIIDIDSEKIKIPILIEGIFETIDDSKINEIKNNVKNSPALLTILFHVSTISDEMSQKLADVGELLPIPVDTMAAEQFLVWKHAKVNSIEIHHQSEDQILNGIIKNLGIKEHFLDGWVPRGEKIGMIIPPLKSLANVVGKAGQVKSMIKCLIQTSNKNIADQFTYYQKLISLKLFGKGTELVPMDIETSNDYTAKTAELAKYGFVNDVTSNLVKIQTTYVEERILSLIENGKDTYSDLKKEFINLSQFRLENPNAGDALKDFYVASLIEKGKIFERSGKYEIRKYDDLAADILQISTEVNTITTDRFLCQNKQRDVKVIAEISYVTEIKDLIMTKDALEAELSSCSEEEKPQKEDEILRVSFLITSISRYYKKNFLPAVTSANTETALLITNCESEFKLIKDNAESIINSYNQSVSAQYQVNKDDFLTELKAQHESLKQQEAKIYTKPEIVSGIEQVSPKDRRGNYTQTAPFWHENDSQNANYFSFVYYKLNEISKKFQELGAKIEPNIEAAINYRTSIEQNTLLLTNNVSPIQYPSNRVSTSLLNTLKSFGRESVDPSSKPTTIKEIKDALQKTDTEISSLKNQQTTIVQNLQKLNDKEDNVASIIQEAKEKIPELTTFLSGSEFETRLNLISSEFNGHNREYESQKAQIIQTKISGYNDYSTLLSGMLTTMSDLHKELKDTEKDLNTLTEEIKTEAILELDNMNKFISLCLNDSTLTSNNKENIEKEKIALTTFRTSIENTRSTQTITEKREKIANFKNELVTKIVLHLNLKENQAKLLEIISRKSVGSQLVDPLALKSELKGIGIEIFTTEWTESLGVLHNRNLVKLRLSLNTDQENTDQQADPDPNP